MLDELLGNKINRIENVLMLSLSARKYFGDLKIWLEPIEVCITSLAQKDYSKLFQDQPTQYKLRKSNDAYLLGTPQGTIITLKNHTDDPKLQSPDRRYLRLHAACAKIAHTSGVAELLSEFQRDYEELATLAGDGSSHVLLAQALSLVSENQVR